MTKAEQWRKERRADYADTNEYLAHVQQLDAAAVFQRTDLGAVIRFSDGSTHRMGAKQ
jgi:hypothetical protein